MIQTILPLDNSSSNNNQTSPNSDTSSDPETRHIPSPIETPETDRGPLTITRFNYEFSYIAMIAVDLYLGQNSFKEILCELHDDVLGVLNNGRFVAIQIKTRDISLGPFKYNEEPIKNSIKKFIDLEKKFPNQFELFQIVSNAGFSNVSSHSITELIAEARNPKINKFSISSNRFVNDLASVCEVNVEIVVRVLQKLEPVIGPPLNNIDEMMLGRNLINLQGEFEILPSQLADTYNKIKQIVMEKCSIEIPTVVEDYTTLLNGTRSDRIQELVNQKRITYETMKIILEDGLRVPYLKLKNRLPYHIDDDSIDLMKRKMGLGGIDPFVIENMVMLEHSAEHFILKEYNKNIKKSETDSKIDHLLASVQDMAIGIRSREIQHGGTYGTRMLHSIEDELNRISNNNPSEFLGVPAKILKGFLGMLTASCRVAFSETPSGGFK